MTGKRYQVFVSSTFADLKDERQSVIQALLEMNCIPSGMEMFPAADEEQFEFIKKIVDASDYYVLIMGGRYGSITGEGISYTELEYDYAIERGKPVCAFVHSDPGSLKAVNTDKDGDLLEKLERFREKVKKGRLVKLWKSRDQLPGYVVIALNHAIATYPSPGWVRGDETPSLELYQEMEDLRKENDRLRNSIPKTSEINAKPIWLKFKRFADQQSEILENSITVGDCIKIVPTGAAEKSLAVQLLADMVTEFVYGFEDAMDYELTQKSIDDLVFILDQIGYVSPREGYLVFTTKFRRAKLKADFGLEVS